LLASIIRTRLVLKESKHEHNYDAASRREQVIENMKAIDVAPKLKEQAMARSWNQNSNGLRRLLSPASALIPSQPPPGKRNSDIPLLGKLVSALASVNLNRKYNLDTGMRLPDVTVDTPASGGSVENGQPGAVGIASAERDKHGS
jgi:hypothetical protein